MKKLLIVLFIGIFLFAVSRPVQAGGNGVSAGALIGVAVGIITFGILATTYSTSEREVTNRRAITEEHLTQREQIRASTVLAAPSALGGSGNASYSSPEGTARIEASVAPTTQYQPAPPQPYQRQSQRRNWCGGLPYNEYNRCVRENGLM